jgi:hypothetical protein
VEFAANHHVDLVMMPTHGVGTFRSFLVGSVTAKVLHDANCPVWTAAHALRSMPVHLRRNQQVHDSRHGSASPPAAGLVSAPASQAARVRPSRTVC